MPWHTAKVTLNDKSVILLTNQSFCIRHCLQVSVHCRFPALFPRNSSTCRLLRRQVFFCPLDAVPFDDEGLCLSVSLSGGSTRLQRVMTEGWLPGGTNFYEGFCLRTWRLAGGDFIDICWSPPSRGRSYTWRSSTSSTCSHSAVWSRWLRWCSPARSTWTDSPTTRGGPFYTHYRK